MAGKKARQTRQTRKTSKSSKAPKVSKFSNFSKPKIRKARKNLFLGYCPDCGFMIATNDRESEQIFVCIRCGCRGRLNLLKQDKKNVGAGLDLDVLLTDSEFQESVPKGRSYKESEDPNDFEELVDAYGGEDSEGE